MLEYSLIFRLLVVGARRVWWLYLPRHTTSFLYNSSHFLMFTTPFFQTRKAPSFYFSITLSDVPLNPPSPPNQCVCGRIQSISPKSSSFWVSFHQISVVLFFSFTTFLRLRTAAWLIFFWAVGILCQHKVLLGQNLIFSTFILTWLASLSSNLAKTSRSRWCFLD